MKYTKQKLYLLMMAVLSVGGILLYRQAFADCLDDRGLLIPGSFPLIALLVLIAAAIALAAVFAGQTEGSPKASILSAIGTTVFACGTASLLLGETKGPAPLTMLFRIFTVISAVCLLVIAVYQFMGKKPFFLLTAAPCALSILHLMECYQLWSERPQWMEYVFGLGAVLCVMLYAYHYMADQAALKSKFVYLFAGCLGIFFCCGAYAQGEYPWFFAAAAVWMLTGLLCCGKEPEAVPAPEEELTQE